MQILIAASLFSNVERRIREIHPKLEINPLDLAIEDWQSQLAVRLEKGAPMTVILTAECYLDQSASYLPELLAQILQGSVRLVFWDLSPPAIIPIPAFFLAPKLPESALVCLVRQIVFGTTSGLQNSAAPGSRVFLERIAAGTDIGAKLDKCIQFFSKSGTPGLKNSMAVRLCIFAGLAAALEDFNRSNRNNRRPSIKLQATLSGEAALFSIKWAAPAAMQGEFWKNPPGFCRTAIEYADFTWVNCLPESGELEYIFLFSTEIDHKTGALAGVDYIITTRIAINPQGLETASDVKFDTFARLPELAVQDTEVREDDETTALESVSISGTRDKALDKITIAGSKDAALEKIIVAGSKASPDPGNMTLINTGAMAAHEIEQIRALLVASKSQITMMHGQLSEMNEKNQSLSSELKKSRFAAQKPVEGSAPKEIEALKKKIEFMKTRETTLIQKLSSCIDEIKRLQQQSRSNQSKAG